MTHKPPRLNGGGPANEGGTALLARERVRRGGAAVVGGAAADGAGLSNLLNPTEQLAHPD